MAANEEVVGMVVKLAAESTDFQNQMNTLNRQMKVLQSEYKATSSGSKDFDKSLEGLRAKSEYLNKALETQQKIVEAHAKKVENSKNKLEDLAKAQNELKSKVDAAKSAYEESAKIHGEDAEETKKLAEELSKLQEQYDKNNSKINNATKNIDNQTIAYNNARAQMGNLEGQLRETTQAMDRLGTESQQTAQDVNSLEGNANPFEQFTGGVKEALGQTKIFGVSLGDVGGALAGTVSPATLMTGAIAGITSALTDMVVQGIQRAIAAIGDFIKSSMQLGEGFQAQMSKVGALSGAANGEMTKLTDTARRMGKESVYSAKEAAQGLEYMALAGWKTEDSIKGIPDVLNLASAAGMDLGRASDIVTDYLTAFGLTVDDTTRMVDVMAYAMSHSNTDVEMLGEAYKNCASTCTAFGIGLEETTSWLSKMADAGIKGGEAGTALNSVLSRLYGQNEKTTKAMEEYGLSMYDANGKAKPFTQTMQELEDKMSTMSEQEKNVFLRNVAGTNQLSAFSTMLKASAKEAGNFANQLENSAGAAEKMTKRMNDNIEGLKKSINSKVEDIKISLFTAFEPIISMVLKVFETFTGAFSNYIRPFGDFLNALLSPIRSIFNGVMDIIQALNAKLAPIINGPLTVVTSLLKAIGTIVQAIVDVIVGGVNTILTILDPIIQVIQFISDSIQFLGDKFKFFVESIPFETILAPLNSVRDVLNETFKIVSGMFSGTKENIDQCNKNINGMNLTLENGLKSWEKQGEVAEESCESIKESTKTLAEECGHSVDYMYGSFEEMFEDIQKLDDETYSELKASADKYKDQYSSVMDAVDQYESDMLKKKMDKWESTHKSMEGTLSWYTKRAEYAAKEQEKISDRTSKERDRINKQYTSKMEQEFKKQQGIQDKHAVDNTNNYKKDYNAFAKNEEDKTKKLQDEMKKRSKLNSEKGSSFSTGFFSGLAGSLKIPGYASGTSFHPGGLAIVGEKGPELANFPRGTGVSTNSDTASMLRNANSGVESLLSTLISKVDSLERTQKDLAYSESALVNM